MAITRTDEHRKIMLQQALTGALNLQRDARELAFTFKEVADTQSEPLAKLQARIDGTLENFDFTRSKLKYFKDVTAVADPRISIVGAKESVTTTDIGSIEKEVYAHLDTFRKKPRNTYAQISNACQGLIDDVDPIPSVWD